MEFRDKQIAAPKSWATFEDLCHALFQSIWEDTYAQRNGRLGQPQHGVDVYGSPKARFGEFHGIQCKGKDQAYGHKVSESEFRAELEKAESFSPRLSRWTLVTTSPNDAELQRVVREISAARVKQGGFPVSILGWESVQSLLADHPKVVEKFYPEHTVDLAEVIFALREIPSQVELVEFRRNLDRLTRSSSIAALSEGNWIPVMFDKTRDLGPALMGRPLGPADVGACPLLPESGLLISDLKRCYSARITGVPGAGKSVCALQAAHALRLDGWRVVRLMDPKVSKLSLIDSEQPTLHLVDDAHLMPPALLQMMEQMSGPTKWLLSAHTVTDGPSVMSGGIRLDAKRAVKVIAAGLRSSREETLRAVQRADDRIGDRPHEDSLEDRLQEAEASDLPWQFCFVLGGGWRRARAAADSARAAGADLVLAAAAIRQLASRDARCKQDELAPVLRAGSLNEAHIESAIEWLLSERLLLSRDDLRCPHQRFAMVLLKHILAGQDDQSRTLIGSMLHQLLDDRTMPLAGLRFLLHELRFAGDSGLWSDIVQPEGLDLLVARCWQQEEKRHAPFLLSTLSDYIPGWPGSVLAGHIDDVAGWISDPAPQAAWGVGRLLNEIQQNGPDLAREIVARSNPEQVGRAISHSPHARACEIADMVSNMAGARSEEWTRRYMAAIDRDLCLNKAASWPKDQHLSYFATYCRRLFCDDEEFGLDLVEAIIPVVRDRLRSDPIHSFHELNDIAWHVLRLFDPLGLYVGKYAPTHRMREIGRKLASCWSARDLGHCLSISSKRDFQPAAGLLSFLRKAAPRKFRATVAALDWDRIDTTIGDDWKSMFHEAEVFLGICYGSKEARPKLCALIKQNLGRIAILPARLALIAPDAAQSHVEQGGVIALSSFGHFHWEWSVGVLAGFAQKRPDLVSALLAPHETVAGAVLSNKHPSWFEKATLFLRLLQEVAPDSFARMLNHIDVTSAEEGWINALKDKGGKRQSVAFLIHCAVAREDVVGEMARRLRMRYPVRSTPSKATLAELSED